MKICIERHETDDKQTTGKMYVYKPNGELIFHSLTMELPWKQNMRRVSCIPAGRYPALLHTSPKFGPSIWIKEVDGRSEILIHKGNYHRDTLGCILPGKDFIDIDGDGHKDVTSSSKTMKVLLSAIKEHLTENEPIFVQIEWDPSIKPEDV